ncbi:MULTISPECIES: MarR family winged helix-turn-helix transcriptional regulator [unclassified Rhizobium]|uniref:MarR family winged helix-turn-helix transcriptional regulator n=1 Tax=unclassified Rhizobium TaxID=2613769 RepID=UPI001ADB3AA4|nr:MULTISPECIES: MarR family winged helix-turn-helix transcriptional regulator [unclassified Rhizobium]MBO9123153.1 winged helix-turn-helix transcriptional regulator [Rhizobium sp. 16-488-2b]MBO9173685.1 winged helix-turn-helix transcriptional regulator [Rhizobium sp. 16-488-2a]
METPDDPTPISHRVAEGLARVAMAMRSDEWTRAEATGLKPTQLAILDFLGGRSLPARVKEVAAHLGVSQPTATDSVSALERKGLVRKSDASGDRRAAAIEITDEGRDALAAAGSMADATTTAVGALPAQEQQELLMSLVKVIRHLQEADAIPVQRMCATCRYFSPYQHPDAAKPHHCHFVNAAFGQNEFRIDCRDHEIADPATRAATWDAFQQDR